MRAIPVYRFPWMSEPPPDVDGREDRDGASLELGAIHMHGVAVHVVSDADPRREVETPAPDEAPVPGPHAQRARSKRPITLKARYRGVTVRLMMGSLAEGHPQGA